LGASCDLRSTSRASSSTTSPATHSTVGGQPWQSQLPKMWGLDFGDPSMLSGCGMNSACNLEHKEKTAIPLLARFKEEARTWILTEQGNSHVYCSEHMLLSSHSHFFSFHACLGITSFQYNCQLTSRYVNKKANI